MKLNILLVEPNDSIRDLIKKNLEREFGAVVYPFKETADALKTFDESFVYDLLVVRNFTEETVDKPSKPIAAAFLNLVYDRQLKTPLIVIGEFEHAFKNYAYISDRLRIEELNRLVLKSLNLRKEDFDYLKLPDYLPYSISYFYLMTMCPCDVFIKLSKKTGDEYVKRLHIGENFTKESLNKYEELGLEDFYILKGDREVFMNSLLIQTLKNLRSSLGSEKVVEATGDSFLISTDLVKSLGINASSVVMVDQTLLQMRNQLSKNDKLGILIRKLLDDHLSYSYRRSFLVCLFSHTLIPKMEWGSQEQQSIILEKLNMVSFFHDIFLEDEKLLKITDYESLKKAKLDPAEKELVMNHANKAALLIQNYPRLPQGVDVIIKQHHGVSNGVGFAEVLSNAISPMAIFFVVIEDFVTSLLEDNDLTRLPLVIEKLKIKYQLPAYRRIVTEIEAVVLKK